ncbi:pyocin knob domain-containing protein [Pullulanibacillus sp. KACC 23026]|uniref:pyocin knob domain-containing protein n=1 Tax=Pullulanibacillus sp. KACC 23026 TaxID=3028315 RepID=UPI0023B123DC|nr:pyocin knob domain-containing protein [Pullulanibacillus sp. KACC 23026]WEG14011.1 pyocin knob domain-containing protein [Pullulanibacillus sp. KACC 23026]
MTYAKTTWQDRVVQNPNTYTMVQNSDGTITLIPAEGTITQSGTPITADKLNNLETQYDQAVSWSQGYGLGLVTSFQSSDLNNARNNGWYQCTPDTQNTPPNSGSYGVVRVDSRTTDRLSQTYYNVNGGSIVQIWTRFLGSTGWSAWTPITTGVLNIKKLSVTISTDSSGNGNATLTYPAATTNTPTLIPSHVSGNQGGYATATNVTTTGGQIYLWGAQPNATRTINVMLFD